jgi:ribosomal protein S18 acetylase RimI-like enzyme
MTQIRIRYGTAEDAQLLAEIGAETFYDAYVPDIPAKMVADFVAENFSLEIQTAELADPGTTFLIAEIGEETAGYAMLCEDSPPEALVGKRAIKLPRIYLRQTFIGQGVGSMLMQACIDEAERHGFEAIWLGVWDQNDRAQGFYRKWGFEQFGSEAFQFGEEMQTDLLFYRHLDAALSSQEIGRYLGSGGDQ